MTLFFPRRIDHAENLRLLFGVSFALISRVALPRRTFLGCLSSSFVDHFSSHMKLVFKDVHRFPLSAAAMKIMSLTSFGFPTYTTFWSIHTCTTPPVAPPTSPPLPPILESGVPLTGASPETKDACETHSRTSMILFICSWLESTVEENGRIHRSVTTGQPTRTKPGNNNVFLRVRKFALQHVGSTCPNSSTNAWSFGGWVNGLFITLFRFLTKLSGYNWFKVKFRCMQASRDSKQDRGHSRNCLMFDL
ncbi:hypothetical protein BJ742DRAFT_869625 [Cladochytrium replicatum]|nr:hypothetical protein BJ742DRAFT_869625 [Cladochytrium replicatum]